ncbi:MAG: hypothetical protein ABFD69_01290 [Candidatus Sumerlaeia bacterium]
MKKVLMGCGVLILIVFVIFGFLVYQGVKLGKSFASGIEETKQQYDALNSRHPFTAPADGIVTQEQMARWIVVRDASLAPVQNLDAKLKAEKTKNPLKVLEGVMGVFQEIARTHVTILDGQKMSMNEYAWVTKTVLGVLNSGDGRASAKLKPVIEKLEQEVNRSKEKNTNMMVLQHGAPLTSAQIERMLPLVEAHAEALVKTAAVFSIDAFIVGGELESKPRAGRAGSVPETTGTTPVDAATTPALAQ